MDDTNETLRNAERFLAEIIRNSKKGKDQLTGDHSWDGYITWMNAETSYGEHSRCSVRNNKWALVVNKSAKH
jgi:hypothetical protein